MCFMMMPLGAAALRASTVSKTKVGMCTMVKDEVSFLFEWLEYYQQQGVSYFRIYDDGASDNMDKLPQAWRPSRGANVSVSPVPGRSGWGYAGQMESLEDCITELRKVGVDWIGFLDPDEFVTFRELSPQHTVQTFLSAQDPATLQISFQELRYGSEKSSGDPAYAIRKTDEGWTACVDGDGEPRLVTETALLRQPCRDFEEDSYQELYDANEGCLKMTDTQFGPWSPCWDGPGKVFLRAGACTARQYDGPHTCSRINDYRINVNYRYASLNHYVLRSTWQQNFRPWMMENAGSWLTSIQDDVALRTVSASTLRKGMPKARCPRV